ncbi:MAG: DUF418 domain-containing protein [Wenzhouxiangella sp.]|nr:MAG: DUF418 domain-containing protein [Wenzhouxiangella sp.]
MGERFQPTSQRLLHLDVLRGFALLGILLVNFEWFVRPLQAIVLGAEPDLAGASLVVDWLIKALAEGKFYALFSMLFGAGFALMAERAHKKDVPFWGVYLRRLILLLLFGIAHMLLIWAGDILVVYSLSAFVMVLLFRKTPIQRLWKWALVFFILPIALMWLGALSIAATQFDPEIHTSIMAEFETDLDEFREGIEQAQRIHNEGSWRDNVGQRLSDATFILTNFVFWVPPILGFFLLGRWLVASERLTRPAEHQLFFRRWRSRGLLFGLPLSLAGTTLMYRAVQMVPTLELALGLTLFMAGSIFLALAYLSMVTLGAERLRFLAPAGQMALTNYLTQSLFWTWMMYGHGLGLGVVVPRWSHLVLALAFFAVQVAFSHWWMARFRFGPFEWLWRSLTYLQLQPLSRHA